MTIADQCLWLMGIASLHPSYGTSLGSQ